MRYRYPNADSITNLLDTHCNVLMCISLSVTPFCVPGIRKGTCLEGRPSYGAPESTRSFSGGTPTKSQWRGSKQRHSVFLQGYGLKSCWSHPLWPTLQKQVWIPNWLWVCKKWKEGYTWCSPLPSLYHSNQAHPCTLPTSASNPQPPSSLAVFPIPVLLGSGLWLAIHTKVIMGDKKLMAI